jgi:hypothetical protein
MHSLTWGARHDRQTLQTSLGAVVIPSSTSTTAQEPAFQDTLSKVVTNSIC